MVEADGKKRWLSNTMEGYRFALACTCEEGHVRYATLKSIKSVQDLCCWYCQPQTQATTRGKHKLHINVTKCERQAMDALQSARLDRGTAFQVLLPFWQGRVDFYHISSRTVIQVDGCSHFTGTFYNTTCQQLLMDVRCCCEAWKTGVRMLRVHHMCADYAAAMLTAVLQQYESFVMLTPEYAQVQVCCRGQDQSFVQWVQHRLPSAHMITDTSTGCFLFV